MPQDDQKNEHEPQGAREPGHVGADDALTHDEGADDASEDAPAPGDANRNEEDRGGRSGGRTISGRSFAGTSFAANEHEQTRAHRGESQKSRFDSTGSGDDASIPADES